MAPFFFSVLGFLLGFPVLFIFLALCSILELEAAISMVFAACLSSNQHFGGICGILELEAAVSSLFAFVFEFEPFVFDGICNILVLELFM